PHVDYNSALGPLYYWVVAAGLFVKGHSAGGLVCSNLILLPPSAIWTWFVCIRRFSALYASLCALFVTFLLLAPRAIGISSDLTITPCAISYNRIGWVLSCTLFLQFGIPGRDASRSELLES